uniref:Major Facilitator Superfamily, putative n=1 Tax=Theileria annulata TaxID=5874 RepID=A0A3B0N515_THEAN
MRARFLFKTIVYFLIATITGPFFDNWTTTEKFLFQSDAYVSKCVESDIVGPPTDTFRCEKQQIAISSLLSYARMFEFASSVTTGILVDYLGPRIVAIVGVFMCILSWIFLVIFPKSGTMLRISMILIGLTSNATLFPALTIERYSKNRKSQVMIFVGSSSSFTCLLIKLVELVARKTPMSPKMVGLLFIFVFLLPCLVGSFLFFPDNLNNDAKRYLQYEEGLERDTEECLKPVEEEVEGLHYNELARQVSVISLLHTKSYSRKIDKSRFKRPESTEIKSAQNESLEITKKISLDINPCSVIVTEESSKENLPTEETGETKPKWNFKGFLKALNSVEVIVCTLYFSLNVVSITYSQQSYTIIYSSNSFLLAFAEYVLPFSFIPCIIFIFITRCISPYTLIMGIGVIWALMQLCSMFYDYTAGIFIVIFFNICYSIYNTQVYIYIESVVNKDYYSSILGFLNTMGGVSLLVNMFIISPLTDKSVITNINIALLFLRILFLFIFTFIYFRRSLVRWEGTKHTTS